MLFATKLAKAQSNSAWAASPRQAPIQAKLTVRPPGDAYEQEADRIAEEVMRKPEGQLHKPCACGGTCKKCESDYSARSSDELHTKALHPNGTAEQPAPPLVHETLSSPGQALDAATRVSMERRFGHDFSAVRVHSDAEAADSAQALGALAYTVGPHVVFAAGQYATGSAEGRKLLAHELTHVVQQSAGVPAIQRQPDNRWVNSVQAAHYRGEIMAQRIKNHGLLSTDARAKIVSELDYFKGAARDAYIGDVKPALVKVGATVTELEPKPAASAPPVATAPPPAKTPPPETKPAPTCKRLPDSSGGKRCKFYVYDDSVSGAMGVVWKRGAIASAKVRSAAYVIPSSKNMEETLHEILSVYAEKDCDCTDEIQFWGHGSPGNAGYISEQEEKGTPELTKESFDIPGLEKFGDDTTLPGYREWHDKLTPLQSRLVLLRRTICDSDSTIYYRSCEAFHGQTGIDFAEASSQFWRCDVSGHTKDIGLSQPGKHTLAVCQAPDWDPSEGEESATKKDKTKLHGIKPK